MNVKTSYKKLWKILIDRDMTKTDLRLRAGISSSSLARLNKGESVTTAVLLKICEVLNCDITEIMSSKAAENVKPRKIASKTNSTT